MQWLMMMALLVFVGCAGVQPAEEKADLGKKEAAPLIMPTSMQCFPWEVLSRVLFLQYRETNVGVGVLNSSHGEYVTHLFVSENGTWSFTVTSPDAVSCIMAYGTRWKVATPPAGA